MGIQDNFAKPGSGRFTVQYHPGKGHAVHDPDGQQAGEWFETRASASVSCAHKQRAADRAAKRVIRPCMCCRAPFQSEGIHNRLCKGCGGRGDALGDPQRPFISKKGA